MPGPLAGTLNALNAPTQADGGFYLPAGASAPRAQQREMGLNEIIGKLAGMAGEATRIPQMTAWNLGPALVGRSGQGPQTGAEALQRLGLNYNSPGQRALGAGAGKALDLLADPLNLVGAGGRTAPAAASAAQTGDLARRLEQFAGPGVASARRAEQGRATLADALRRMSVDRPPLTGNPAPLVSPQVIAQSGTVPGGGAFGGGRSAAEKAANRALIQQAPTAIAEARASGVTVPGTPSTASVTTPQPVFGRASPPDPLGGSLPRGGLAEGASPSFLHQIGPGGQSINRPMPPGGFPDFPAGTPGGALPALESARFLNPTPSAASRLDRLVGTPPAGNSAALSRRLEQYAPPVSPTAREPFPMPADTGAIRGRTQPLGEVVPFNERSGVPGVELPARRLGDMSARTGTTPNFQDMFAGLSESEKAKLAGEIKPASRPSTSLMDVVRNELPAYTRAETVPQVDVLGGRPLTRPETSPLLGPPSPLAPATTGTPALPGGLGALDNATSGVPFNLRAAFEALRNPGRGQTLGPRSPTLPNGPIDY